MLSETKVLTVNELADYLRIHRSTVYRLLKQGLIPAFKIGSDWRFNVEAIDRWRMAQGEERVKDRVSRSRAATKASQNSRRGAQGPFA